MSPDPNSSSHLSKSASSAQSRTKAQANPAPEPSSPAEPMTDPTPKSVLVPPPTRIVPPELASDAEPTPPAAAKPASQYALAKPSPVRPSGSAQSTQPPEISSQEIEIASDPDQLAEPVELTTEAQAIPSGAKASGAKMKVSAASTPAVEGLPETTPETVAEVVAEPTVVSEAVSEATVVESTLTPESETPETASEVASTTAPEATLETVPAATSSEPPVSLPTPLRQQPIPPASEPMQYRAIGLVRGKYMPSEEQFTRGFILTDDEVLIDAVLLGRVMSLVKKHINLDESHLWVVYPRTREKDLELHMQIVGVWEPDKLNRSGTAELEPDQTESEKTAEPITPSSLGESSSETTADQPVAIEDLDDRYFSVRGEVVYQSDEEDRLLVKIRRAPKPGETEGKAFKVALKGSLQGKALGYFWDMQVQRQNSDLLIMEAVQIGMVPPQKRGPGTRGSRPPRRGAGGPPRRGAGGPPKRRWDNNQQGSGRDAGRDSRPYRSDRPSSDRPSNERSGERPSTAAPSAPRQPISKPVKRQKEEPST